MENKSRNLVAKAGLFIVSALALVTFLLPGNFKEVSAPSGGLSLGGGSGTIEKLPIKTFLGLTDTPNSYSGQGGKTVAVNAGATGLEFIASGSAIWGSITGTLSNQTDLQTALDLKSNLASPTFTGTVVLPSTTSIGTVSNTEIGYLDNVTSSIQTQLNAKESALTFSTGLTRATNTITSNLSTGVSGGQSVIGGTASGNNLILSSTSHATKGQIILGTSIYDEVNQILGIGTTPTTTLSFNGTADRAIKLDAAAGGVAGKSLTVAAGSATSGTDINGGNLILQGGVGTGLSTGNIVFQTGLRLTTGSTVQTMTTVGTLLNNGNFGIGLNNPIARIHTSAADGGAYLLGLAGTSKGMRVEASSTSLILRGVDNTLSSSYQPLGIGGTQLLFYTNGTTETSRMIANGNFGLFTTAPDKKLEVNLGTSDALRLTYNDSNGSAATYMDTTVSSVGLTTFTGAGSAPAFAFSSTVRLKGYTVATLPAGTVGDTAYVTDALAPTFLAAVVGGGAITTPVFYNGAWVAY